MNSGWAPAFLRNAGWNLMEVPAAFNLWMNTGVSNHVLRLTMSTLVKAELLASYGLTQWMFGLQDASDAKPAATP